MSKIKYKKYKTLYLPRDILEATALTHSLVDNKDDLDLSICLDMIHNVIQKSNFIKSRSDNRILYAPMSSVYLKKRYGNNYKLHRQFLDTHSLIYSDHAYENKATYFYLQSSETYQRIINSRKELIQDSLIDKSLSDVIHTYCFTKNIEIDSLDTINIDVKGISKNRIYDKWYKVKVLITKSNKSYFTKDYEADSKYINNAPKHIKKMGSHFRKNFKLDTKSALKHTHKKYLDELEFTDDKEENQKAYNRYASRINSIMIIEKGKTNKSLRFNRNLTNDRLDTNLTNMASDLKPFIIGWKDMVYLDLKNSQPVLFNVELNKRYDKGSATLKAEIDRYRKATFIGEWYEELMGIYNKDRDSCKDIWMCIAYSKNKSYKGYKKPFKKDYPEIFKIIETSKVINYQDFAIKLQKLESKIFIDKICKELVDVGIIPFTVHDALIVQKSKQEEALKIMTKVLTEHLGDTPKIAVE